jgi:hypothetical protein
MVPDIQNGDIVDVFSGYVHKGRPIYRGTIHPKVGPEYICGTLSAFVIGPSSVMWIDIRRLRKVYS